MTIVGVLLIAFIGWFFWFKRSKGTRAAETSGGYQGKLDQRSKYFPPYASAAAIHAALIVPAVGEIANLSHHELYQCRCAAHAIAGMRGAVGSWPRGRTRRPR